MFEFEKKNVSSENEIKCVKWWFHYIRSSCDHVIYEKIITLLNFYKHFHGKWMNNFISTDLDYYFCVGKEVFQD